MSRKAEPGTEKRREYFPLYFSYGKRLASLTDEQMGIVVRAALQYAESGTIPELEPVCRLALDNIIYDIDRASSSYEDICRQNRENGEKGGRPKNGTEKPNGSSENRTVPAETEKTQYKDEYEDEDKREDTEIADAISESKPQAVVDPEAEEGGAENVPFKQIVDLFHRLCPSFGKLRMVEGKRKQAIAARWRVTPDLAVFEELFRLAEASDFLKGQNARNWHANFDWLMCATNFQKVLEHRYDNKNGRSAPPGAEDRDPFIAFMDAAARGEEWTG